MVLVQLRRDDGLDRAAEGPVLRHQPERPLLDLLQQIDLAVGAVEIHVAHLLVDERLVARRPEQLPGVDHVQDGRGLRHRADVVVAGVEPAADVQPGDPLAGRVLRVGGRPHLEAVEMLVVHRRLARVVHVRGPVPDPVRLVDEHVVHLHREPDVERLLPGVRVGLRIDREHRRPLLAVLQEVEAGAVDRGEVERRVRVAQVLAPRLNLRLQPLDGVAGGCHLEDGGPRQRRVVGIELDHGGLLLRRVVARLREADHRRALPALDRVRAHRPLDDLARRLRRQQRAHHVPAVLRHVAPVEQHQAARTLDHHSTLRVLGGEHQRLAGRDRVDLHVLLAAAVVEGRVTLELADLCLGGLHPRRSGRVEREDARPAVGQVGLLEVRARQELEVEARAPGELRWQRPVEKDADGEALQLRLDDHARVEVERLVAQQHLDRARLLVHGPLHELRDLVPLLGRRLQPHRAAGRGAYAVVDQLDAGRLLVEEHAVVLTAEDEHVEPPLLEVLAVVQGQPALAGLQAPGRRARGGAPPLRPGRVCSCCSAFADAARSRACGDRTPRLCLALRRTQVALASPG